MAYDAEILPTLRGLDINAAGSVFVLDIWGRAANITTVAANLPYRWELQIKKIIGDGAGSIGNGTTGTNVTLANLTPLA